MPILDQKDFECISRSAEQTRRLGMHLGTLLHKGDVILLQGDLGAGKTTFTQGLASGWGSQETALSPTFVLINQYSRPDGEHFFHLDAYRLNSPTDAEDLDLDAILAEGVLVVEWPERIRAALPKEVLTLRFNWVADEQRSMLMEPSGAHYQALVKAFRNKAFKGTS